MKKKITKCPYCGSAGGVCNEFKVSGINYYRFNGLPDGEEIQVLTNTLNTWSALIAVNAL